MVPYAPDVSEHIRDEELTHCRIAVKQYTCPWDWMATHFTMIAVVFAAECTLSGFAQLGGSEERLTLLVVAAQPPRAITLSSCHCPR